MKNLINILLILLVSVTTVAQTTLDSLVFEEINRVRNEKLSHKNYDKKWYNTSLEDTIYYDVEFDTTFYENTLNHNKSMYVYSLSKDTTKKTPVITHNEFIENDTINLIKMNDRYPGVHWGEVVTIVFTESNFTGKISLEKSAKQIVENFMSSKPHKRILLDKEYTKVCVSTYEFTLNDDGMVWANVTIVFYYED